MTTLGHSIVNGGFENILSNWSVTGSASVETTVVKKGSYALLLGSKVPYNGSAIAQQSFTLPLTVNNIKVFYQRHCSDSLLYGNGVYVYLIDNLNTSNVIQLLPKACTVDTLWNTVTVSVQSWAGKYVNLELVTQDDGYPGDASYSYFDGITVS